MEVVFRRVLESDEVVGQVPQAENLPPGESLQVDEDRKGLLPVVTYPGERMEDETVVIAAQVFQQVLG